MGLQFQKDILQGVIDNAEPLPTVAFASYRSNLEPFHGWLLKNTFHMALNGMPRRDEFMQRLPPTLKEPEREQICVQEMQEAVEVSQQIIDTMRLLFQEL